MLRTVVEARTLVAMMVAACVGTWGLRMHPVDHENLFLALIAAKDPTVFHVLTYGYATMWFSTPFFAASLALSMLAIVAYRHAPSVRTRALPPYPSPERRRLAVRRTWRGALSDYAWPRAFAGLADDPAARALHRNRDSRALSVLARLRPACIRTSTSFCDGAPRIRSGKSAGSSWK